MNNTELEEKYFKECTVPLVWVIVIKGELFKSTSGHCGWYRKCDAIQALYYSNWWYKVVKRYPDMSDKEILKILENDHTITFLKLLSKSEEDKH